MISVLTWLGQPAVVIGQSMGGTNAYLAASRRPDLVRALVVVEAGTDPDPGVAQVVDAWLEAWPVPFASLATARAYFASINVSPLWASTLVRRHDGYVPQFEIQEMVESAAADADADHADEWTRVRCPTLVVAGSASSWGDNEPRRMASSIPHGSFVVVEGAGHDVHLDSPDGFREVVETFLGSLA